MAKQQYSAAKSRDLQAAHILAGHHAAMGRLLQEHAAYRVFTEAVAAAIRKHPEMSNWIGDEQEAQRAKVTPRKKR